MRLSRPPSPPTQQSGHFKRLLVSILQGSRSESLEIDREKAKTDAKSLLDAGEKSWGTDESRFNVVLASRSPSQLRLTFEEYKKLAKKVFMIKIIFEWYPLEFCQAI